MQLKSLTEHYQDGNGDIREYGEYFSFYRKDSAYS